ncbi:MAG: hypothetical protein L0211_07445 [Planctomycetaceae bacterium]|nr:hypothetical protein [Planctomycetaceae bacterium]
MKRTPPTVETLNRDLEDIRERMTIAYMPEHFTDAQQLQLIDRMVELRRIELGIMPSRIAQVIVPPISAATQ